MRRQADATNIHRVELRATVPTGGDPIDAAASIEVNDLRDLVRTIAKPRHRIAQPRANRAVRDFIAQRLREDGYDVSIQGEFENVVAVPSGVAGPWTLIGAHYDSVELSPGADDNASGVAAVLACARAMVGEGLSSPVCYVGFNGEEEGLLGSREFFASLRGGEVSQAHVLESIGYFSRAPGSQRMPAGLPARGPDVGDFLGLVSNGPSSRIVEDALRTAELAVPSLKVVALKLHMGLEKWLPVLHRSDHSAFWMGGVPAILWTDTAEFRNANYHRSSDTPETLDYDMLRRVSQLLLLVAVRGGNVCSR